MEFRDAVASAGPHENNLHLAPDRQPHQHLITEFLQAGCSSWRTTNSVKALKTKKNNKITCRQNQTQTSLTCLGYFRGRPRGLLVGVVSTGAAGMVSSSATMAPSLSTPISRPASCCTWAHKPHTSLYYMRQSTRFCMDTSKLTLYVGSMAWWLAEFVAITRLTHVGPG